MTGMKENGVNSTGKPTTSAAEGEESLIVNRLMIEKS